MVRTLESLTDRLGDRVRDDTVLEVQGENGRFMC